MKTNLNRQSGSVVWPVVMAIAAVAAIASGIWLALVLQPIKQQEPQLNKETTNAALKSVGEISFDAARDKSPNENFASVSVSKTSDDQKQSDGYDARIHHLTRAISSDQFARQTAENALSSINRNNNPTALKKAADLLVERFKQFDRTIKVNEKADIGKSVQSLGTVKATYAGKQVDLSCYGLGYAIVRDAQEASDVFIRNEQYQYVICGYAADGYSIALSLVRTKIVADLQGTESDRTPENATPKINSDLAPVLTALKDNFVTKVPFTFTEKELKL